MIDWDDVAEFLVAAQYAAYLVVGVALGGLLAWAFS